MSSIAGCISICIPTSIHILLVSIVLVCCRRGPMLTHLNICTSIPSLIISGIHRITIFAHKWSILDLFLSRLRSFDWKFISLEFELLIDLIDLDFNRLHPCIEPPLDNSELSLVFLLPLSLQIVKIVPTLIYFDLHFSLGMFDLPL
jgi:hypothetical protein